MRHLQDRTVSSRRMGKVELTILRLAFLLQPLPLPVYLLQVLSLEQPEPTLHSDVFPLQFMQFHIKDPVFQFHRCTFLFAVQTDFSILL